MSMRRSKFAIKPWQEDHGLLLPPAKAERALSHALKLVGLVRDREIAWRILAEAAFRVLDLPRLDPEFRQRYAAINSPKLSAKQAKIAANNLLVECAPDDAPEDPDYGF